MKIHLSKSRYLAGAQCAKQLWWKVHEPGAPELVADSTQSVVRGREIGELARAHLPGGLLIDLPHYDYRARIAATVKAIADGAPIIYEASFLADDIFVSADMLERQRAGFVLIEVKSTLDVKDEHILDVAVQLHVLRRAGLDVRAVEIMHLNRDCHHPDLSNLFVRERVTRQTRSAVRAIPAKAAALLAMLGKTTPDVTVGPHCHSPYPCPFVERCWPKLPEHHVSSLYRVRDREVARLASTGIETIGQLPLRYGGSGPTRRQIRSVKEGKIIVERGLARALAKLKPPLAFLDFETVNPAVPVWPGCAPYEQVPIQLSCHVQDGKRWRHHEWLADGSTDPRERLARALIEACAGAKTVIAYNAPFEKRCIDGLAARFPELRRELDSLSRRLHDLLPVVRDFVYHPRFHGSFSIKSVLPALVPKLGYDDLAIASGSAASAALEALLLTGATLEPSKKDKLRSDLLRYCERDTLALVRIYEVLRNLAVRRRSTD